jgi:predicted nucleic acid-binding protein
VFLDANVLFSAACLPGAGLLRLWKTRGIRLIASAHAVEEARFNLREPDARRRLEDLVEDIEVVPEGPERPLPSGVVLPAEDRPILLSAIAAGAAFLLTGDKRHFGPYYGKRIEGVLVLPPGDFLRLRSR